MDFIIFHNLKLTTFILFFCFSSCACFHSASSCTRVSPSFFASLDSFKIFWSLFSILLWGSSQNISSYLPTCLLIKASLAKASSRNRLRWLKDVCTFFSLRCCFLLNFSAFITSRDAFALS